MSKAVCLAQTVKELNFILQKVNGPVTVVPLDLTTHLYCIDNNINYYNPISFIKKDFHLKAVSEADRLINGINFGNLRHDALKKEFTIFIRSRFYSAFFLIELINKINILNKIEKICVSGWNKYVDTVSEENYFLSYLAKNLLKEFDILEFTSEQNKVKKENYFKYLLSSKKILKKKTIILNSLGYKMSRILFHAIKRGYKVILFDEKISFAKKFFFLFLGVKFVKFEKSNDVLENQIKIPDINFQSQNIDFSKILNYRKNQELQNLNVLNSKCYAIKDFFNLNKVSMIFTNTGRGIGGFLAEAGNQHSIPSVCINHGIIAKSFNNFDKIYKKIVAERVCNDKTKYFSLQSKIAKDSLATHKVEGKTIETGNILFQEGKRIFFSHIMYAVTLRHFDNLQFLGDEMFYEFLENLKFFENLSKKHKLKFLIKLHPIAKKDIYLLEKIFKNLKFTVSDLKKNLQKTLFTISYASTVIEDSLNCGVPVVLFDRWQRYKHCDSQTNPMIQNEAIYYITNEEDLLCSIDSIKKSKQFNFYKYIYSGKSSENIKRLFSKIF